MDFNRKFHIRRPSRVDTVTATSLAHPLKTVNVVSVRNLHLFSTVA